MGSIGPRSWNFFRLDGDVADRGCLLSSLACSGPLFVRFIDIDKTFDVIGIGGGGNVVPVFSVFEISFLSKAEIGPSLGFGGGKVVHGVTTIIKIKIYYCL